MAIDEGTSSRESTRREAIDEMLKKAGHLARENNQAALRLRAILVGAPIPTQDQQVARPAHPGWLGEIADTLEVVIQYLADTAKAIEEISQQVAMSSPTPVARR